MKKYLSLVIGLFASTFGYSQVTDTGDQVGIGNVTPTYKLDVNGDINLSVGNVLRIGGNQVFSTQGLKNMFLGDGTGTNLTSASYNAAIGFKAGEQLSTGQFNTLIGFKAGQNMSTASSNTIIGKDAGKNNSGNQNVLIGREAGINNNGGENTFIGDKVGLGNTTGTSNTLIGKNANVGSGTLTNATAIGAGAIVNLSNALILGSGAKVGIGTSAPAYDLDVTGDINFTGTLYENGVPFAGGATGPTGAAGADGANGVTGAQGPIGPAGTTGTAGLNGSNGTNGIDGVTGATGPLVAGSSGQTLRNNGASWEATSAIYNDGTNIGIGTTSPTAKLHINNGAVYNRWTHQNDNEPSITVYNKNTSSSPGGAAGTVGMSSLVTSDGTEGKTGIIGLSGGGNGSLYGVSGTGHIQSSGTNSAYGVYGRGQGNGTGGSSKYGVYGSGSGTGTANYGVYGTATGATTNWAGYFASGNVYMANNVGIGTTSPSFDLDVSGDINFTGTLYDNGVPFSNAIFVNTSGVTSNGNGTYASDDLVFGSPQMDDDRNTAHDSRMFFDKSKAAFRAGKVYGPNWDVDSLGAFSVAFGYNTKATGNSSIAFGYTTKATGDFSMTMGRSTEAIGDYSAAMGGYTEARGQYSIATGLYSNALGVATTAMGGYTNAESGYETVIGRYDTDYTASSTIGWNAADRLFVVGNGSSGARSDAMVILKNGNVGIGTSTPTELLEVEGDARINGSLIVYGNSASDDDFIYFDNGGAEFLKWDEADTRFEVSDDFYTSGDVTTGASNGVINIGGSLDPLGNVIGDVVSPSQTVATGDEDLWIEDDLEVIGQAYKSGGGSWATISDKRLKTNIRKYEDGLEELLKIEPKWFEYNDKWPGLADGRSFVGVMAQDMLEIAPYMVEEKPFGRKEMELENGGVKVLEEGTDYYTYDPSALTYMLVNAVKEQQEIIEERDERIANNEERLQNAELRNEQMAERLARMEEMLFRFDTDLQQCCTNWTEGESTRSEKASILSSQTSRLNWSKINPTHSARIQP